MKNLIIFIGYFIIFLFLYIISFINIEKIISLDFFNIYVILYFIFFIISIFLYFLYLLNNNIFNKYIIYIFKFIFFANILLLPGIFINHQFLVENLGEANLYLRSYGRLAMLYFALALIISPILIFIKNELLKQDLILIRKILGILSAIFFLKHGLEYFALEYIYNIKYALETPYIDYVIKNLLIRYDALSGIIAGVLMFILFITSNKFSVKFLGGKKWKKVQLLVFPAFLFSIIHIAFAGRLDNFYIFLIILVISLRLLGFINKKEENKKGKIIGYRCIPCGYIYDEKIGDPDGGIAPGTKFEDIPDDWFCPVCFVTKNDFEPIYEGEEELLESKVYGYKMLTGDVLELKIKVENIKYINVKAGQYANIIMNDKKGKFTRSYSVVNRKVNIITFAIKLKQGGRGGEFLKNIKIGDLLYFGGIYGNFVLKDTINPKVFIATGTGLSPIINMLKKTKSKKNILFFGVQKEKDLFYLDKLSEIKNLEINIYLSKENIKDYNFGRITLKNNSFEKNTEFYICGNRGLVESNVEYLKNLGFKNIYNESF